MKFDICDQTDGNVMFVMCELVRRPQVGKKNEILCKGKSVDPPTPRDYDKGGNGVFHPRSWWVDKLYQGGGWMMITVCSFHRRKASRVP